MKKLLLAFATVVVFASPAWAAVDLNSASQAELESVKGIGPKKAQNIIEYRKKNGNFKSVEDLDKVPGFGKKTVTILKKELVIGNARAAASAQSADSKMAKTAVDAAKEKKK